MVSHEVRHTPAARRPGATEDPIFTLIADYWAAEKAVRAASRAQDDLEERLNAEDDAKHPHIPHPARIRLRRSHSPFVHITVDGCACYAFSKAEINELVDRKYSDANLLGSATKEAYLTMRETERKELTEKLVKLTKERAKGWRTCGLTQAKAAYERADRIASEATRQMCRTKPTTVAGLAALLDVLRKNTKDGLNWDYNDGRSGDIYKTVAAAAHGLAGNTATRKAPELRLVAVG